MHISCTSNTQVVPLKFQTKDVRQCYIKDSLSMRHELTACGLSKTPESDVLNSDVLNSDVLNSDVLNSNTEKETMKQQTRSMYEQLLALGIHEHARDFWRIRAAKQKKQVLADSVLHEHTALTQYMQWHNTLGVRLPCFLRGSENSVAYKCMK